MSFPRFFLFHPLSSSPSRPLPRCPRGICFWHFTNPSSPFFHNSVRHSKKFNFCPSVVFSLRKDFQSYKPLSPDFKLNFVFSSKSNSLLLSPNSAGRALSNQWKTESLILSLNPSLYHFRKKFVLLCS